MTTILITEPKGLSEGARSCLAALGELRCAPEDASTDWFLGAISDVEVLFVRLDHQIDAQWFRAASQLETVVSPTTGLDHIDLEAARARSIEVLSLAGEREFLDSVRATPEHTWALLMAVVRRIAPAARSVLCDGWNRDAFRGQELSGRRIGLVGLGRVGSRVAHYAQAFGMAVHAYDPQPGEAPDYVTLEPSLEALLGVSDVLSIHVPLNEETTGLLGRAELALLPRGAYVVNTSRGEILDASALVEALEAQHLAGAALDVVAHEREREKRARSPLLEYARSRGNLLITPHIAGATVESMARTEEFMAAKLARRKHVHA